MCIRDRYFAGVGLKKAEAVKDKYIPLINGSIGIVLCTIWVFATCLCGTPQDIAMAAFTAITQAVSYTHLDVYKRQR